MNPTRVNLTRAPNQVRVGTTRKARKTLGKRVARSLI